MPFRLLLLACLLAAAPVRAQFTPAAAATGAPLVLSVDDAVAIALAQNYALRASRYDVETAEAQVREAWGQILPQVSANGSYTRNVKQADPFAGSDAGGLFGSIGSVGWLAFNEEARTDGNPATTPISLAEFQRRQAEGYQAAGINLGGSDNPFGVPTQITGGVSITQPLFNGSAIPGIRGARTAEQASELGAERQAQIAADNARQAYYAVLLAQRQVGVFESSARRVSRTVEETALRVEVGAAPKYDRLTAEVELGNTEAQLIDARASVQTALDNLKLTLGVAVARDVQLQGDLDVQDAFLYASIPAEDAVETALERRADLTQAALQVELSRLQVRVTKAQRLPSISAFADLSYTGSVPDDRSTVLSDPDDPFAFEQDENGFFSSNYWNPNVSVGVRLSWNLFTGGQRSAQIRQQRIAVEQAELQAEQLGESVRLEVAQALRDVRAARERILARQRNEERAATNYTFAEVRVQEGVSSPFELREASQQLDQTRLDLASAAYDYLIAESAFASAIGQPAARQPTTLVQSATSASAPSAR